MKKAVRFILQICFVVLVLLLSSCSMLGVGDAQLKEDIIKRDEIQNCYNSDFTEKTEYVIDKVEITKEQLNKDDKEDLIFCNVSVKNEYFKVSFDLELLYNYYDKGGWIMDDFSMGEITVVPIAPPPSETIEEKLLESYEHYSLQAFNTNNFNEYILDKSGQLTVESVKFYDKVKELQSLEKDVGDDFEYLYQPSIDIIQKENIHYAQVSAKYVSDVLEINGFYDLAFANDEWRFEFDYPSDFIEDGEDEDITSELQLKKSFFFDEYKANYSQAIGKYKVFSPGGSYGELEILSIDEDSIEMILNYDVKQLMFIVDGKDLTDQYYCTVDQGQKVSVEFDPFQGRFPIAHRYGSTAYATYDYVSDEWEVYGSNDIFSKENDVSVEIGVYTVNGVRRNAFVYEAYVDDTLSEHMSLRIDSENGKATIREVINKCVNLRGAYTTAEYSDDGKVLIEAYDEEAGVDAHWRCYVNKKLLDVNDYCDYEVEYGDKIKLVYVYENAYENYLRVMTAFPIDEYIDEEVFAMWDNEDEDTDLIF